jgi:hypothetical protein
MMSRVGGFPPSLARYLIAAFSAPGEFVLDPFCGKGTALLEAAAMGRRAIGGDIAPDAVVVARAKCAKVTFPEVARYIEKLDDESVRKVTGVPRDVRIFFHPTTLRQIVSLRQQVFDDMSAGEHRDVATFVCGVMLGLLHGHSKLALSLPCNQCFAMSPGYVRRYVGEHALLRPERDVKACLIAKAMEFFPRPTQLHKARVWEDTADKCGMHAGRAKGKIRLVVTSPPYLNRQTYIKDSWLRLWFLQRDADEQRGRTLETGGLTSFINGVGKSLSAIIDCVSANGVIALVCGQAKGDIRRQRPTIRVSDLCLYALEGLPERKSLEVISIVRDRKLMKRGSYFAVHNGMHHLHNGDKIRRFGEEEILLLRKKR